MAYNNIPHLPSSLPSSIFQEMFVYNFSQRNVPCLVYYTHNNMPNSLQYKYLDTEYARNM